jgi:hypothetical protein
MISRLISDINIVSLMAVALFDKLVETFNEFPMQHCVPNCRRLLLEEERRCEADTLMVPLIPR